MKTALLTMLLMSASLLTAQTNSGQITGQVFDEMKAAVPAATVSVTNIGTNITQKFQTTADGIFTAPSLQPGQYRISVEMKGFNTSVVDRVEVFTGRVSSAEVSLKLGAVTETITVGAQAPLLSNDTSMIASTVESVLIEDLPTSERSTMGVILLAPGVTAEPGLSVGSENPSAYTGYTAPNAGTSVGGGIPGSASVLVNGAEVSSASLPRTGTTFSRDTAKEVTIVSVGVPAQYGRTGGGVINQTTRSGSNTFHGGLGWSHTDPGLMARQHGAPTRPNKRQNYYNGTLSGPIEIPKLYNGRNRSFFLVAIEPSRMFDVSWTPVRIPTPAESAGKLNDAYELIDQSVLRARGADAALAAPRTGGIYWQTPLNSDGFPVGNRYSTTSQYVPIPNNDLSAQLAKNPVAKRIMSLFPTVQNPGCCVIWMRPDGLWDSNGNNVYTARGVSIKDNRYSFKLDHQISENDRISGRFSTIPIAGVRFNYWGLDSPVNGIPQDRIITRNAILNETHTFKGSSMINEFRMTYTRVNTLRNPNPTALSKDWGAEMGLTPATVGYGFPAFSGGALKDVGSGGGDGRVVDVNFGVGDDLSIMRGRHAIKMGIDVRSFQMNKYSDASIMGGGYSYGQGYTNNGSSGGSPLASFMLGYIESYSVKTMRMPFYYRWRYYAGYIQDDFKLRSNLTFNIGLRYQLETPRYEKYNMQGSFIPELKGMVGTVPVTGGFAFSNHDGRSQYLWPLNYMGFEPRFGVSWAPLKRMTVRASYALLHAPLTGLGNQIVPDLNVPAISLGGTNGGVNVGIVNYLTNPLGPIQPNAPYTGAPMFSGSSGPVIYIEQSNSVPYINQFSFAIQYQAAKNSLIETGYMGTKGVHLITPDTDFNRAPYATMQDLVRNRANFQATLPNALGLVDAQNRVLTTNLLGVIRPYGQYYNATIADKFDRRGNSMYHAWYLMLKQRMTAGLNLQATYTVSKSIDDCTNPTFANFHFGGTPVQNADDLHTERSVSSNDIPQRFIVGYSYELPIGKGKRLNPGNFLLKTVLAGWKTSGMYQVSAGAPFRAALGGNGYWFSQGGGDGIQGSSLRPNIVLGKTFINPDWRKNPYGTYINPEAFSVPGSLDNPQFGNAARTLPYVRGPRYTLFDASVFKSFKVHERATLDLRADILGAMNHPGFLINPGSGHNLTSSFNRAALTNPSIQGFVPTADFGKLNQNNTLGARNIKITATLRF